MNDPAMTASGYEREPDDFYRTPSWVTRVLLRHARLDAAVWEPAAGDGAIADVLDAEGLACRCSDLVDRGRGYELADFLATRDRWGGDVVTNPPYKLAEPFVRHALSLTYEARGKVAMLLRHEWDTAAGRHDLFQGAPFAKKITLLQRPRWFEGTTGSPRHAYAWFLWDWAHEGAPTLAWDR